MTVTVPRVLQRLAALALLLLVLVLVYGLAVAPTIQSHRALDVEIQTASEMIARYETIADTRESTEGLLMELSNRKGADQAYLGGQTYSLAAAELQNIVTQTVARHQGKVRSIQVLPAVQDGGARRVSLRAQVTASYSSLLETLYALETHGRALFIEQLDVRRHAATAPSSTGEQEPTLVISLDVAGYRAQERKNAGS